jgi:hypothetical protein
VVLCHTWLACQEEVNFTAAHEFLPERWLQQGELTRISPFLVVPFGCGRRICPGKRFVEQELHIALAKVTVLIHLLVHIFFSVYPRICQGFVVGGEIKQFLDVASQDKACFGQFK